MNKMLSHFKNKYYKKVLKTAGISLLMLSCIGLYAGEDTDIVVAGSNNIVNCNTTDNNIKNNNIINNNFKNSILNNNYLNNEINADVEGYVRISSAQDLLSIKDNPAGHYILVNDIDMAGYDWTPVEFSGELEGNGYSILNLTVNSVSQASRITYDGNMKTYDTVFSGMFSIIENAAINNLSLINERITVETDNNCFVAGIAGYSDKSTISGCTVKGTYELTTGSHMFGVAGVTGFGNGTVRDSDIDVTLICTDTNVEDKDEQFMGGVIADGYMTISNCNINIAGYDSDHGYVHDGGIIGMNMPYPKGSQESGNIRNCTVNGFITFFEDNTDRRAYCSAIYGEMLGGLYVSNNKESFNRDERYDYSVNLRPEQCGNPKYTTSMVSPDCNNFGYTTYTCQTCGYSYNDNYTLKKHQVSQYNIIKEADYEHTGVRQGICSICNQTVSESIDKLIKADSCTISSASLELNKKENVQLTVTVTPTAATVKNTVWESTDTGVATVDSNGIVTAVGSGKAVISYSIDGNVMAKSNITVKSNQTAIILICVIIAAGIIAVITGVIYAGSHKKQRKR